MKCPIPTEAIQLNKKLDKYAHKRKFNKNKNQFVSCNLGVVHHFNLGCLNNKKITNEKILITLIDYIRFYKSLFKSEYTDLKNAEFLLLKNIVYENQKSPFIIFIGREWEKIPCLFIMIHVTIEKNKLSQDLALLLLNTHILDKSNRKYPVHVWFIDKIYTSSIKIKNKELSRV